MFMKRIQLFDYLCEDGFTLKEYSVSMILLKGDK